MKKTIFLLSLSIAIVITGCGFHSSFGRFSAGNLTQVELSEANYKIVKKGVQGTSSVRYVNFLGVFRSSGTGRIHQEAIGDLWANFEHQEGPAAGRALALVNVVQDYEESQGFLLFTKTIKLTIRADVVEFVSDNQGVANRSMPRSDGGFSPAESPTTR